MKRSEVCKAGVGDTGWLYEMGRGSIEHAMYIVLCRWKTARDENRRATRI